MQKSAHLQKKLGVWYNVNGKVKTGFAFIDWNRVIDSKLG